MKPTKYNLSVFIDSIKDLSPHQIIAASEWAYHEAEANSFTTKKAGRNLELGGAEFMIEIEVIPKLIDK